MNAQAFWILLIPLAGLFAILRDGRWNWNPVPPATAARLEKSPLIHRLLVAMFWIGWFSTLIVGLLLLFRPTK